MIPRIGITTSYENDEQRLAHAYVDAVAEAGGLPLIVPMVKDAARVSALVELLDGLVVTGGPAVTQGLVGEVPPDLGACPALRSEADTLLLDACLAAEMPVLGICYGMQLLNARRGGTLYADVEKQHAGAAVHARQRGATEHPVQAVPGTVFADLFGTQSFEVNTRHVQAVATVGEGLWASAFAPDGVIEALEGEGGRLLGVQFHPEGMGAAMQPLFRHFIRQARAFRLPAVLA